MNKLQRTEYKSRVVDFGKWWMILSTIMALIVSIWVVSEFRAVETRSGLIASAAIVYFIVWALVYLSGIVWVQVRAYKRALKL